MKKEKTSLMASPMYNPDYNSSIQDYNQNTFKRSITFESDTSSPGKKFVDPEFFLNVIKNFALKHQSEKTHLIDQAAKNLFQAFQDQKLLTQEYHNENTVL